jgi:hypothetical protein
MLLFPDLEPETRRTLDTIPALINETFPLPRRFRAGLPEDIAELSRLLTGGRGDRSETYLGKPPLLSAYIRYFLPWNIYRLCRLLPALPLKLSPGDAITDLGAGPLTLTLALWIARPELRTLPLELRCLDRTATILDAGKKLFSRLTNNASPWNIKTIHASIGAPIRGKKAALVCAINVFNELEIARHDKAGLMASAVRGARTLAALGESVLVLEPGIPRSGEFITALRSSLMEHGLAPHSPCPHGEPCPMSHGKWCHFAFETHDAPAELLKCSAAAGLPKERATLSFLLAGQGKSPVEDEANEAMEAALPVRIVSDAFPVNNLPAAGKSLYGRYGCSLRGMVLVTGSRADVEGRVYGSLQSLIVSSQRDSKTGFLLS